jgi:hypothetical protein
MTQHHTNLLIKQSKRQAKFRARISPVDARQGSLIAPCPVVRQHRSLHVRGVPSSDSVIAQRVVFVAPGDTLEPVAHPTVNVQTATRADPAPLID